MRWDQLPSEFLRHWRVRAQALYLRDIADPKRKKDGTRSAGQEAALRMGSSILRSIDRELKRRGEA